MPTDRYRELLGFASPPDDDHVPLHAFDPAQSPEGVTLRHPDVPGHVVVNARSQGDLDAHRQSVRLAITAHPPGAGLPGFHTLIADAAYEVTGETIDDLVQEAYVDPIDDWEEITIPLGDVLGYRGESVVGRAVADLLAAPGAGSMAWRASGARRAPPARGRGRPRDCRR